MPSITKTALIDDALYWSPAPNTDGYPDRGPFGDPVEVKARWIDGQLNLDHANSSYMYIDRDVEAAGYVMKGTLYDLLPGNMTEYPNEADGLGAWAAHWQFDETLDSQDDGPSFVINDGEVKFGDGARDEALTNDGSDIYRNEIETATVVDLSDSSSWILGFWLKVQAPASPSGSPSISPSPSPSLSPSPSASDRFLTIEVGGIEISAEDGSLFVNGEEYFSGLYDNEWSNIQVINDPSNESIKILVNNEEQAGEVVSPIPAADSSVVVRWLNDSGELFWLDEMLLYNFSPTNAQTESLASRSPLDYDNAKAIKKTQFASSINGKLRVRKLMLEGPIQ